MSDTNEFERADQGPSLKGWLYVCGLALFFLIYGLFMFYMIGDKGPPGWDFGTAEDIPGESVYSTNQPITGGTAAPEPQHVSQKPPQAEVAVEKEKQ
jgi:hypothetical protein